MFEDVQVRIGSRAIAGWLPLSVELLSSLYVLPAPQDDDALSILYASSDNAPWKGSLAVAPAQTAQAVITMLKHVMCATSDIQSSSINLDRLVDKSRARLHLSALKSLWDSDPKIMPSDLVTVLAFMGTSQDDALQPITGLEICGQGQLPTLELAVIDRLRQDHRLSHGSEDIVPGTMPRQAEPTAATDTLLGHVQRKLRSADVERLVADDSLYVLSVRDALQECEAAAAIVQKSLDDDASLALADIAILLPNPTHYGLYLQEAFALAGITLSALPIANTLRDIGAEVVQLFIQSRRRPAPAMALASLLSSRLMPWTSEVGQQMSRRIMSGDFQPGIARELTGHEAQLYSLIRGDAPQTSLQLADELRRFSRLLTRDLILAEQVKVARKLIERIAATLDATPIDAEIAWDEVMGKIAFASVSTMRGPRYYGAITILGEHELPSKSFRHILVLGFNDGRYPAAPSGNALFLDSEIETINAGCGLALPTQAQQIEERLAVFVTQIAAASERLVILLSERDREGTSLSPSSTLPLIARLVEGIKDPKDLIIPLEDPHSVVWGQLLRQPDVLAAPAIKPLLVPEYFELGCDLLGLRKTDDGEHLPQSPSRLETLLVSPLAWLLNEIDSVPVKWAPEALDVRLKGSLAHEVFERLFLPGQPLPDDAFISENVASLLSERIRSIAPFLQAKTWGLERATLEKEIMEAAIGWSQTLRDLDAEVIGNEFWLNGVVSGVPIHGKADCLIRLRSGQPIIIDHKKSKTAGRRSRLAAQWDLQVDLYRNMTVRISDRDGVEIAEISSSIGTWPDKAAVAYHLMNDGGVLVNGAIDLPLSARVENIEGEIAVQAMAKLETRITSLRAGRLETNSAADPKFFEKTAFMGLYAFESSPLVTAFMRSDAEADMSDGEYHDD